MIRSDVTETKILPVVANHTTHNGAHANHINHDYVIYDDQAEIELVKINSPAYNDPSDSDEQSDSAEHESCLNEASNFIIEARRKNLASNEDNRRLSYIDPNNIQCHRQSFNTPFTSNDSDTTFYERAKEDRKQIRNHFFDTINDFLDELENSSDDERPNKIRQNYFDNKDAQYDGINVFDQSIYVQEGPTLIYSFKNKNCVSETNESLLNSPNKESPNTSTDSNSVKNFNDCTVTYERNFYRVPKSFPPVIIPRLPLTYMLPTVTEIIEPSRASPKITEIYEEDVNVTRKPNNSWVMHTDASSNSEGDNTLETNIENSADGSLLNNTKESLNLQDNTVIVHYQNHSMEYDNEIDTINIDGTINKDQPNLNFDEQKGTPSPKSTRSRSNVFVNTYIEDNQQNNSKSFNKTDSVRKEVFGNYSIKSRDRNSTPNPTRDFSSVDSIPTLHLSLNTEIETTEESWFKRFIKCILCCK